MSWTLSRFRAGDLVVVRSKEEILATLDQDGCIGGMPFMPEMLQYCGQGFRVSAVAHKTCEVAHKTYKGRRLQAMVHLAGLRCDGSAHGGCEADCNLFWKDEWLKPAGGRQGSSGAPAPDGAKTAHASGCTESQLLSATCLSSSGSGDGQESRYSCQATKLYEATEPLAAWDPRQYAFDVLTRNHSPGRVLRVVWLALLRELLSRVPLGYRFFKFFNDRMHLSLAGRTSPDLRGRIERGAPTPTGRLDLRPGENVRIKSQTEIEQTLDEAGKNRGLGFDQNEMTPYCGRVFKVRSRVNRIIDEQTGKMLQMKQPCIILEDVVCKGEYSRCRLNCPRAIPAYWREIWLERVTDDQQ